MDILPLPDYRSPVAQQFLFLTKLESTQLEHEIDYVDSFWDDQPEDIKQKRFELTPVEVVINQIYVFRPDIITRLPNDVLIMYGPDLLIRAENLQSSIIKLSQTQEKERKQKRNTVINDTVKSFLNESLEIDDKDLNRIADHLTNVLRLGTLSNPTSLYVLLSDYFVQMIEQEEDRHKLAKELTNRLISAITAMGYHGKIIDPATFRILDLYRNDLESPEGVEVETKLSAHIFKDKPFPTELCQTYRGLASNATVKITTSFIKRQLTLEVLDRFANIVRSTILYDFDLAKVFIILYLHIKRLYPSITTELYHILFNMLERMEVKTIRHTNILGNVVSALEHNHNPGTNHENDLKLITNIVTRLKEDPTFWPGIKEDILWLAESNEDVFSLLYEIIPDIPLEKEREKESDPKIDSKPRPLSKLRAILSYAPFVNLTFEWTWAISLKKQGIDMHTVDLFFDSVTHKRRPYLQTECIRYKAWLYNKLNLSISEACLLEDIDPAYDDFEKQLKGLNYLEAHRKLFYYLVDRTFSTDYKPVHRYAMQRYSKNSRINEYLRANAPLLLIDDYYWYYLKEAFLYAPRATQNFIVYRGHSVPPQNKNYTAYHPLSTTIFDFIALAFTGDKCCLLQITVKKDTPFINMIPYSFYPDEREYLLPPGTMFYEDSNRMRIKGRSKTKVINVLNYMYNAEPHYMSHKK